MQHRYFFRKLDFRVNARSDYRPSEAIAVPSGWRDVRAVRRTRNDASPLCRLPLVDGLMRPHMLDMITFKPNPHTLRVTPSAKEAGRFDWWIKRDSVIVRQSVRSFGSEGASEADGDAVFREITSRWQSDR